MHSVTFTSDLLLELKNKIESQVYVLATRLACQKCLLWEKDYDVDPEDFTERKLQHIKVFISIDIPVSYHLLMIRDNLNTPNVEPNKLPAGIKQILKLYQNDLLDTPKIPWTNLHVLELVNALQGMVTGALLSISEHIIGLDKDSMTRNHLVVRIDNLLSLAIAINKLSSPEEQIDLTPFKDEGLELIEQRSGRKALLAQWKRLDEDNVKFNNWAENELKQNLIAIAEAVGATSQARLFAEEGYFSRQLQQALALKK